MHKKLLSACAGLVLALSVTPALQAQHQAQSQMAQTFKGVLIDNACYKAEMSQEELENHTRDCALMDGCMASGYALVTADKHVYKLDAKGNEAAVEALKMSEQAGNLKVTITAVNDMGTLKVQSLLLDKM